MRKFILIMVCTILAIVLFLFFDIMVNEKKQTISPPPTNSNVSSQDIEKTENSEVSGLKEKWDEITFEVEASMANDERSEYNNLNKYFEMDDTYKDNLGLYPKTDKAGNNILFDTGHQIYKSEREPENEYIISGHRPIRPTFDIFQILEMLREEGTGKRIIMAKTKQEFDFLNKKLEEGQNILNDNVKSEDGTIILDGMKIESKFIDKNGEIYINIKEVFPCFNPNSTCDNYLGIAFLQVNDYRQVVIPLTNISKSYKDIYNIDFANNTFKFTSWNGEKFTSNIDLVSGNTCLMPIKDLSIIAGWKFYTNGNNLSIITDEKNYNPKIVFYNYEENIIRLDASDIEDFTK